MPYDFPAGLTGLQLAPDPTEQWDRRNDQVTRRFARADDQVLDRPPRQPEPVEHWVVRVGARIRPLYLRLGMEPARAFDLQQHAWRVSRVALVKSDLEGERSSSRKEVDLVSYWTAV